MECRNIQEKLSAYIDDILSSQEKALVKEHLKSCGECTAVLADLRRTVEYLKGLETVEPPAWMAQKIMTRVRAEARPKKSLFQKLFYPLHIKLPIEAVATVLVVGLALYIYRDIAPEMKLAQAPVEEAAPQVRGQQPTLREAEDKGVTPPVLPSDKVRSGEGLSLKGDKGGFAGKAAPAPERPAEKPASSKEPESIRDHFEAAPKAPEPMKQAESMREAKAPTPAKKLEQTPAAGAIAKDEARQELGATAPGAKLSFIEKKKGEPLTLTVFVKDPETAVKEIEKIVKELEGKSIHTESVEGKKVVSAMLKANRLHELSEKLKIIGEIRKKELDLGGREEEVRVHVEVTGNSQQP
jgi:hypothetical protein